MFQERHPGMRAGAARFRPFSRGLARPSLLALVSTLVGWGCSQGDPQSAAEPGEAGVQSAELGTAAVPILDPDGPQLAPLRLSVPVYAKPDERSARIGALRLGAKVARSADAVSKNGCPGGWYAIYPMGYVCSGESSTLDLQHPLVRAIAVEPDRSKPMPYSYAFVRAIAPNYLKVPSKDEQFQYEMRLERHLRSYKKLNDQWDKLDVGANDVPLNEKGIAQDAIPDTALPLDMNRRYGGNGDDTVPWWLQGGRKIENVSGFKAPAYAVIADRIKRHAGVSLIGSFVAGEEAGGRRFAIATDGRLIPADKLKADSGSPFHGHDIRETGLPVAFSSEGAHYWDYRGERLSKGDALGRRQMVPLTGVVKVLAGSRMVETRDGRWLKSDDLNTVAKPSQMPWFAKDNRRWIDISILSQTLVLWEGKTPVYATLVSTGRDGLGDPRKTLSTPQGTFTILQKLVTGTMDSEMADKEFELRDVPWVMYFKGGYALHAAYWHDDFGRERSHGCVNLAPIDARYVFHWSTPDVPAHWHGASAGDAFGEGTLINIHP
jgi:hypothetical protein